MKNGERYGEREGRGVKDSWPNGCKAVNRVKNSPLWSGSMNADALRPFSPVHKHLLGVKDETGPARRWRKMRRGRQERGRERWWVVGLQSQAPIFNLNRSRYVIRTVG